MDDAVELNDRLLRRTYPQVLELEVALADELSAVPSLRGIARGELLLDIPSKEREKPSGERGGRVFVYDRTQISGSGLALDDASSLSPGLREQHKQVNRVCRVFLAPRWARMVEDDIPAVSYPAGSPLTGRIGYVMGASTMSENGMQLKDSVDSVLLDRSSSGARFWLEATDGLRILFHSGGTFDDESISVTVDEVEG